MPLRFTIKSKAETGEKPPEQVVLDGEVLTVGRDKVCNLVLADPVVSRKHVQLTREGALYFLEDLGSSFGTRVNGAQLPAGEKRLLKNGDVIAVGPYDLTFDRLAAPAPSDSVAAEHKTQFLAKNLVKDALRGLSGGNPPYLRVMNGPLEGKKVEILEAQEIFVGREEGVEIRLENDDLVSRRHVKVRRDWSGIHLEDLQSRNGVRVNKKKVNGSQPLKDRDEIEIGNTRLLFLDPNEVREAPVVPSAPPRVEAPKPAPPPPAPPKREEPAPVAAKPPPPAPAPPAPEPEPESEPEPEPDPEPEEHEHTTADPPPAAAHEDPPVDEVPAWKKLMPIVVVAAVALGALGLLAAVFFAV